jgi:outer membrane protein
MKPIAWILNIIMAVAIIVLYYLHFKTSNLPANKAGSINGNMKIAYFEIDSIENNYTYFKEVRAALIAKDQANTKQLEAMNKEFNIKRQELDKLRSKISPDEIAKREEELMKLDIDKSNLSQKLSQDLQIERDNRLLEIRKKIDDYLAIYNKDKAFSYIFSNDPGLIYFKDNAYDITPDIIKGLNQSSAPKK